MRLHAVPAGATSGFMCMRARTCVYVSTCVCMYVCRSVCLSVCMYLCIYVCMYACLCFFMSFLFTKDQRDQRLTFDALHPHHLLSPSLSLSLARSLTRSFFSLWSRTLLNSFSLRGRSFCMVTKPKTRTITYLHLSLFLSLSLSFCTFFDSDACSLLFGCIFALEVKSRVGGNDAASTKTTDRIFRFCSFPCVFLLFSSSTIAHFRLRSRARERVSDISSLRFPPVIRDGLHRYALAFSLSFGSFFFFGLLHPDLYHISRAILRFIALRFVRFGSLFR